MKKLAFRNFAIFATLALALAGCSAQAEQEPAAQEDTRPTVVTTTNVWADVASQVAGDHFEVIALISNPADDPHSYEASARDQLAVSESALFIMNGGGYDEFAEVLASAAGVTPFNIYDLHEGDHAHEDEHSEEGDHAHDDEHSDEEHSHEDEHAHEDEHSEEGEHAHEDEHDHDHAHDGSDHIWYDLHTVKHAASLIAAELGKLDPANSEEFLSNAEAFGAEVEALENRVETLHNDTISYFEAHPMAGLLLGELGFTNLTPEGFAEAEEAELEPSAGDLATSRELISSATVAFIAVNSQVTSPTMESLRSLAEESGVAVIEFDELLPAGSNYQSWMSGVLDQIASSVN